MENKQLYIIFWERHQDVSNKPHKIRPNLNFISDKLLFFFNCKLLNLVFDINDKW